MTVANVVQGWLAPPGSPVASEIRGPIRAEWRGNLAALDGQPRWLDADLRQLASQQGHAHALLQAYERHGEGLMGQLGGHYALALIDRSAKRVLLACDRFGTKPIAYGRAQDGTIVFGSRADFVARYPGIDASIDPQALFDYAYFHVIPSPNSVYRGVCKLEPATRVVLGAQTTTVSRHWQPSYGSEVRSEAELAERLRPTLAQAIERCTPNETTGAFLSGGLDSSTVAGMLAQRQKAKTFSIGFGEPGFDETHYARTSARHFATEPHEYYVQPDDVADAVPLIAQAYDEPFGNSSAVPTLFCARLARQHGVRQLLAGDGGDEIFGGNERYAKQKIFERYLRAPAWLRHGVIEPLSGGPLGAIPGLPAKLRSYVQQANVLMPLRLYSYGFVQHQGAASIFAPAFLALIDQERPARMLRECYDAAPTDNLIERMLFLDWKLTLADNDLRKVNCMCALEGVEVAYPMLDDDLHDLALQVPADLKVHGNALRYFYKRALRGFLPDEVLDKPKHGFGLPFGQWLKKSARLQGLVNTSLESFRERGLVQRDFADKLMAAHREGNASFYGGFLWVLVLLEQWLSKHAPDTYFGN
jgi:asparagine synthase (glutamine-hydrolysing)